MGGVNIASNAKNGLYNFGAGDADTAEDRAIGGISTGVADGTRSVNMYFKFKNTSDRKVESLDIEYDVEKYRNGNNVEGFRIQLYYSGNGKDWTNAGDNFRTYFAPDADMNGLASVPSVTRNVSGTLPVELEENQDLYLAWNYSVNAGTTASGAMALGIDNVKVKTNKMPLGISSASPDNIRVYINGERRLIIDGLEEFTATVYQVNGQQVCSVTTSETVMPEVSGVYLVKVRCHKTGQVKIAKVIM
ncbi:MAG: hypothetical protein LUG18_06220 [Candidatus Azobacteroides sp.]|nr:hypothetical protein [Candidatus Azobacteroides sp.]